MSLPGYGDAELVVQHLGYPVRYRDVPAADEQRSHRADIWIQPGGDASLDAAQVRLSRRISWSFWVAFIIRLMSLARPCFLPVLNADAHTTAALFCLGEKNASLGLGLCQWPSEAMSASDTFGPQLRRL